MKEIFYFFDPFGSGGMDDTGEFAQDV